MYIGKTVNYSQRKWQHFNREECPALKNAFAKYGIDNFEMNEILSFKAINKEVLNNVLCWLEQFYINKYSTYKKGYNITKGGEGLCGYKHTDEYKQLMSEKQKVYKTQEWVRQKDRERMLGNTLSEKYKRPILRYNLLGNFIKEYTWIGDAIQDIIKEGNNTINRTSIHSNIIRALGNKGNRQHCNKAYDCMWRYKTSDSYPTSIEPFKRKKEEKPLYHYSINGELLESYRTLKEAEAMTGIPTRKLKYLSYNGDLRRKTGAACRTDYWSRIAPGEKNYLIP